MSTQVEQEYGITKALEQELKCARFFSENGRIMAMSY